MCIFPFLRGPCKIFAVVRDRSRQHQRLHIVRVELKSLLNQCLRFSIQLAPLMHTERIRIVGQKTGIIRVQFRRFLKNRHRLAISLHRHIGSSKKPPSNRIIRTLLKLLFQLLNERIEAVSHLCPIPRATLRG